MERYAKRNSKVDPFKNKQTFDQEVVRVASKILKKNQELKSFDVGFGSSVDSTGVLSKLTTVPQGDTDSARDGDALRVIRMSNKIAFTPADTTNTVRFILFRWNQDDSSAAPAAMTDILQTATPFSPYNRDNLRAKKFTVYQDYLSVTALSGPAIDKHSYDLTMQSNIAFQSGANTGTGHFYTGMISDSTASTHPGVNYVHRTWFTDS